MLDNYILYKCQNCNSEVILITDSLINANKNNRYVTCNYCSSKKLRLEGKYNSLKQCMEERSYKRIHGAIRQR